MLALHSCQLIYYLSQVAVTLVWCKAVHLLLASELSHRLAHKEPRVVISPTLGSL